MDAEPVYDHYTCFLPGEDRDGQELEIVQLRGGLKQALTCACRRSLGGLNWCTKITKGKTPDLECKVMPEGAQSLPRESADILLQPVFSGGDRPGNFYAYDVPDSRRGHHIQAVRTG